MFHRKSFSTKSFSPLSWKFTPEPAAPPTGGAGPARARRRVARDVDVARLRRLRDEDEFFVFRR